MPSSILGAIAGDGLKTPYLVIAFRNANSLFKPVWSEGLELMLRSIYTNPCPLPEALDHKSRSDQKLGFPERRE
jgi:hypothetical protein